MTNHESASTGSMLGRTLEATAVAELAAGFGGQLVQPGDPQAVLAEAVAAF